MRKLPQAEIGEGFFVNGNNRIAIATKFGVIEFGMQPAEMREFANEIMQAADRIEVAATTAVDAAFEKARTGRPN